MKRSDEAEADRRKPALTSVDPSSSRTGYGTYMGSKPTATANTARPRIRSSERGTGAFLLAQENRSSAPGIVAGASQVPCVITSSARMGSSYDSAGSLASFRVSQRNVST